MSYNLTRGLVYAALGAASGALGSAIDTLGVHAGLRDAALLAAGLVMIVVIASELLAKRRVRLVRSNRWASTMGAALGGWVTRLRAHNPSQRAVLMGGITALLPCGWLYLWVVAASATAQPELGALVMLAFWLGTLPMLVGVGWLSQRVSNRLQRHAPLLTALAFVAFGIWSLFGRWDVPDSIINLAHTRPAFQLDTPQDQERTDAH
jgi:sulfite exporter TauE/SafE